ncbi:hypothetical protein ACI782_21800 [Geodermatophilus sp. SYSU D00703]
MPAPSATGGDDPHPLRFRPAGDAVPGRPVRVLGALTRTACSAART